MWVAPVTFGVLGPVQATNAAGPVDLKGLRHRAVLARLLIARGRVVPVSRLIDDLWDDRPDGARGAVQTFVGALRKALEPDRPPRTPSRLLMTTPPGYALRTGPDTVDAGRFEAAMAASATLLTDGQPRAARDRLDEALRLWRGPAYAEFAEQAWARAEASRLDELRRLALVRRAEAVLALGQPAEVVPELEALVASFPLREDGWRLLALALYRSGRQGDALGLLRRARDVLRAELGVDPGPGLRQVETDILHQAPHLSLPLATDAPRSAAPLPPGPIEPAPTPPAESSPAAAESAPDSESASGPAFVGRSEEMAELDQAAATVVGTGQPRLALLAGAAGAGKTALAARLAARRRAAGWITAWGGSPELPGAPSAWPWTQMRSALAGESGHQPGQQPGQQPRDEPGADSDGDPVAARFRRHQAIAAELAGVSAGAPVLLVFDDLHWADEETLALVTTLAADSAVGPVLIVGTYRSTEISADLTEALARAARTQPSRIYLGGLTEPQVLQMVRDLTDREVAAAQARVIHTRSAGNPFFVRELARLFDSEGEVGLRAVPAGVRDVIRHRLAGLPGAAQTHLRQAAVIGDDVDLDLLIALAGAEEQVLAAVESALLAGFLVEPDADQLRFAHALVRETLYDDTPRARRARWHTTVAEIVERTRPDDVETIAHHFLRAASRSTADRAAHYAGAAARRAQRRSAPHQAVRLWRETIAALDRSASGHADARTRLEAVMGLVRALAVTGDLSQARRHRADALRAADAIGDPVLTATVIGSFDVPAIWTATDDPALSQRVVAAAERTLVALPTGHEAERARLLISIAMERRADAGSRGDEAARQAETIARRLADPGLLAFALNGRYLQTFHRAGLAPRRAGIGEELLELAGRHPEMVTFEVLGHLILIQAHAALADLGRADEHATAADQLAERYDLPVVGVFTDFYRALRLAVTGQPDQARAAYRAVAGRLSGTGMSGVEDGILPLARLSLDVRHAETGDADWGPYERWARPLVLLAQGRRDEALAAAGDVPDSPHDLLFEARGVLHALVAIEADDRPAMRRLYADLLPAAGELAGAGSGLLTLGPTALYLGHLATALGQGRIAADHYRQALTVARRAGAPQWTAAVLAAEPSTGLG